MVTADKYFSFSISPSAGEPADSFFLGSGSDVCNSGRLGGNGDFPRLSSQAIFSREPSADDTVSAASVATVCDGAAAVACGCDIASAASHNSRHDFHGSTKKKSRSRRFGASHSSSWAATATDAPSAFAASGAKYLTKAQAFPHLPYKTPKEETQEKQHRECDAYAEMALQKTTQGQEAPLFDQELLAAQVKSIYAGLVMVETKCIEVDNAQSPPNEPEGIEVDDALIPQNWLGFALNNSIDLPALIALHSTLLHEQHDFFLASRHPAASPALRRLASKYAMPARMWRHGIHSFLELLRLRLPDLMEHMLTFIYLAYTMMAVLYETVPAFADTWI
ncbi:hypothetical protein CI102_6228 [Trichoderma harzianum]|uniref:Uncharacterized protein n=1 Tax=Trichoderma harzianum CBS 226.95 TaxID=983964 RepID=A0A2T4A086_TRIHA|nr:hypothetical protein M431DRAFT_534096 [Trichoderma harzianum CBS 226.95]PKK47685.1 hypothetical protein CI102_6228 [Trichoderma harzianum]PTB50477.1 hypothetical protein M431DRAFT_534096 [Trichoderma harzianum CBS 226.95]